MIRTALISLALTLLSAAGPNAAAVLAESTLSAQELAERVTHRRAVEAVIWGMPAVNYDLMLQEATKAGGGVNQMVYWSRLPSWKNQTLTPNPDSVYLMAFFNTKDAGPVVLEIPLPTAARSPATSTISGRSRWRMPALRAPIRARAANI